MVRHIEPFRRFTWSKGRLSEPSWLGSWVDSPEHHCEKKICFFLKVGFCRICRFFFFSSSPSIFLFLSCSLFFVPRTPHPTPPHPIAHAARSYLPLHYPPPLASWAHTQPLQNPVALRLNCLSVPCVRHFSHVSGAPKRPPSSVRRRTGAPHTP